MTIYQRATKILPGTDGSLRVHVGDITAGRVLISIYGPNGDPIIDTVPMQEGDALFLSLLERNYVLRLDKLVNLLVGHDYGVFSLMPSYAWEAKKIDRLLEVIAGSDLTFIRNDQEWSGEMFATLLRDKYEYSGTRYASLSEFIEKVASRSSTTGKPYLVKLPSGDIVDVDTWLRKQAAEMVRKPKEEDGTGAQESKEAPPKPGCRLDKEGFERFLDTVETSGVTFTCSGLDLMTGVEFAMFLRPCLGRPDATAVCFDASIDAYTAALEVCGDAYQARLPDGHSVATATWLREQCERVAAETETSKDAIEPAGAVDPGDGLPDG